MKLLWMQRKVLIGKQPKRLCNGCGYYSFCGYIFESRVKLIEKRMKRSGHREEDGYICARSCIVASAEGLEQRRSSMIGKESCLENFVVRQESALGKGTR